MVALRSMVRNRLVGGPRLCEVPGRAGISTSSRRWSAHPPNSRPHKSLCLTLSFNNKRTNFALPANCLAWRTKNWLANHYLTLKWESQLEMES